MEQLSDGVAHQGAEEEEALRNQENRFVRLGQPGSRRSRLSFQRAAETLERKGSLRTDFDLAAFAASLAASFSACALAVAAAASSLFALLAAMVAAFLALACASLNSFNSVLVISCTRHIISPAPTSPTHCLHPQP